MRDLQRRTFMSAGFGLLAAGALAGCSRGGEPSSGGSSASAGDSLRVAWYGGQPVEEGMVASLDAFKADNTGVMIATESAPFDDYWDRLATQTGGGDPPDVMRMSMSYFADYADRETLLDLGQYIDSGALRVDDLDADVLASGQIAGGAHGVGQSSIAHAVFVDPTQLEAVGLATPQIGWTWDDFQELAIGYAAEAGAGHYGCNDGGGSFQAFEVFARQRSGDLFADGRFALGTDVIEEWLAMWNDLREKGAAPPGDVTAEAVGFENAPLVKGAAAMQVGWVQQVTFYQPLTESPLEVVSVPSATAGDLSGLFVKALDFWCVSSNTASPDAAVSVVDFLLNDERAITAIGLSLGVPPSKRARDLLAADPDSAPGRAIGYVEAIADKVGPPPPPWPAGYGAMLSAFARANEQVAFGELDPAAAAAGFLTEAQTATS